jgi:DNA-binding GntR family transcriptional regulator
MATATRRKTISPAKTKAQDAYHQIKQALLAGTFQPGERLVEARVCQTLGLRRGPVREALLQLHGEGFVKNEGAYKGHVVEYTEDIPPDQMLYRYELREQVAGGACRLAAKNMNGWQIDMLREFAQRLDDSQRHADRELSGEANYAFHDFLISNCGNPLLREVWDSHMLMPSRPRSQALEKEIQSEIPDPCDPSLLDIVEAISTHDPDLAESRMKNRVRKVTEALRRIVLRHGLFLQTFPPISQG